MIISLIKLKETMRESLITPKKQLKRWATKTKSQAKLEQEMERKETRNIKNIIMSWQTPTYKT